MYRRRRSMGPVLLRTRTDTQRRYRGDSTVPNHRPSAVGGSGDKGQHCAGAAELYESGRIELCLSQAQTRFAGWLLLRRRRCFASRWSLWKSPALPGRSRPGLLAS
jgi:hypothetical protein